ncbi:MAG: ABC transporter permease [Verrucomicrobiota bacterium]
MKTVQQRITLLVHRYGYPLRALVRRDLKSRYASTLLGMAWTVLQPLFLILLYTLVFSVFLKVKFHPEHGTGDFALYLMCGFLPFLALSEGVQRASLSLTEHRGLVDKVLFPAEVLPAVGVISGALTELIGLIILILIATFMGIVPTPWLALLPLLILCRILITLGLAWLASVLTVFFKDLGPLIGLLLMALMFLTPIFYPMNAIPDGLGWLLTVNPLFHVVAVYRAVLLHAANPLPMLPGLLIATVVIFSLGLWFFRQTINRAKDVLCCFR